MKNQEVTKGGSEIIHHYQSTQSAIVSGNEDNINLITEHIEKHVGPISCVIHEIISEQVHIDIHIVEPTPERNFYTLITSGMSDQPMVNDQGENCYFAELLLALPPDWKLDEESWKDNNNYWPIEWLSFLARFPHYYNTWLWEGHTIPNGENPAPFSENTDFCGWAVGFPKTVSDDFILFTPIEGKSIIFFAIYPLYYNELSYKLEKGFESLCELFDLHNVTELIELNRRDVTK